MKASTYIVDYLVRHGVEHFFGYQGTMIAHFVDAIERDARTTNHSCYNEQGAAFAACGLAQRTDAVAVAYATSGPGAVNLLSGVANAYYDSLPVIFITGQLNAYEYTDIPELRQQGFQETNIVSMARSVTKWTTQICDVNDIPQALARAYAICLEGRRGPVLLDIPMDMQRTDIPEDVIVAAEQAVAPSSYGTDDAARRAASSIVEAVRAAERPVLMLGNGVHDAATKQALLDMCHRLSIPVVTSMLNLLDADDPCNMGYVGSAYGHRWANIIADTKADLLVALGISLCPRQTGFGSDRFALDARIVRVDIEEASLRRRVHTDESETSFVADVNAVVPLLVEALSGADAPTFESWLSTCTEIKTRLQAFDADADWRLPNKVCETLEQGPLKYRDTVGVDVGQHMVWAAQSFAKGAGQHLLFSGGHGAMGYGLPAAIGAHYAAGAPVACICGDGAFQMNIQELEWVAREQLPLFMVVMNNRSLGLISQQQGDFFEGVYAGAVPDFGFTSPNFAAVAEAYGIASRQISAEELVAVGPECLASVDAAKPFLLEVVFEEATKAYPKTYFGESMSNQRPYVARELLDEIAKL